MYKGAVASHPLWPRRGAPAGSRFADLALRIVLVLPLDGFIIKWPSSNLSVYIDDLTTQSFGRIPDVKRLVPRQALALAEAIRQADLEVAKDKGQVVASKFCVAKELVRLFKRRSGCPPVP